MISKSKITTKKKLIILIWNLGIGGVQKRVKDIITDIATNHPNWTIHLLVMADKPRCFESALESYPSIKINYYSAVPKTLSNRFHFNSPFGWIIKNYYRIKPNTTLTFQCHFGSLIALVKTLLFWRKSQLIINEVAFTSKYLLIHTQHPNFEKWLIRFAYQFANKIITPTQAGADDLIHTFWIPASKIAIIPNWTLFKPQLPSEKKWDFIYIGRFEKEKNLTSLLKIIQSLKTNLPKIKLLLLGEGSQELELIKHIETLKIGDNVDIIHTKSDVVEYLKQSKVFMILSLNEGFPNVVLEAAMCQVPTISSNFEGAHEVVKHNETGYICNSADEVCMYGQKLLTNTSLRKKFGENALTHVEKNFSMGKQKKFIKVLLN